MAGICKNINDCTGAAMTSNCTNGLTCCIQDNNRVSNITNNILTKEIFLKVVGDTPRNDYIYRYVVESLKLADIKTPYEISAYLSQIIAETKYFKQIDSKTDEDDFNIVIGNNNTGDGNKFKGRGGILLRGKNNYALAATKNLSKLTYSAGTNFCSFR